MDLRKRRKHSVEKLPLGTVRVRQEKRADGSRFKVRMVKVTNRKRSGLNWIGYARYLWEQLHGPVPKGKRVLHRDGDTMNDEPENLMLGTAADVVYLFCHKDPVKSAENHRRCAAATAEHNRERAAKRRASSILPSKWYAVDLNKRTIINEPHRKRRSLFRGAGAKNGQGWLGWSMGWPELSGLEAFICTALIDETERDLAEIGRWVNLLRERHQLAGVLPNAIASMVCCLGKRGYLVRCGRGTYRIAQAAIDARGVAFPYVAVLGEDLVAEEQYAGFTRIDPTTGKPCKVTHSSALPLRPVVRQRDDRMKVGTLLLDGPRPLDEIAQECVIRPDKLKAVLDCPWFAPHAHKTWRITTAGRTAVTGKKAVA